MLYFRADDVVRADSVLKRALVDVCKYAGRCKVGRLRSDETGSRVFARENVRHRKVRAVGHGGLFGHVQYPLFAAAFVA